MDQQIEEISEITDKRQDDLVDFDDEEDDMLDEMARFVEGQDQAIVKDHSGILDDEDEASKRKRDRKK